MNIIVHIERLVLDGVPTTSDQADVVRAAVQEELVALLGERGLDPRLAHGGSFPSLVGRPLDGEAARTPRSVGAGIGRSVYGALRPGGATEGPTR